MSNSFETTVTVKAHAQYGAFRGEDNSFYKPAAKNLTLTDFEVGKTYSVKGYTSESGKTKYITLIVKDDAKPKGRRLPPPKEEKAGDDKILSNIKNSEKKYEKTYEGLAKPRDFVKEAKGKTFSLIVAGLAHTDAKAEDILAKADMLLKGIEERGYF